MDLYHAKKNLKLILLSHRDGSIIVTNKRANIETINDFKGKTVLIPYQASMHHIIFHKLLTSEGPGQIPMMIEYDQEGIIAGYIVAEPFGTVVVNAGFGDILKLSKEIMPSHPCCAIIARDEMVEKHPEAVQEFITALVASGREVYGSLDETIETATEFLDQPKDVIQTILTGPERRVSMDKLMPKAEELSYIQDYLMDTVTTPSLSGKIDVEQFLDLRFAKNAGAE
jgi:NitT/TauT family transport system substrate-binding protein